LPSKSSACGSGIKWRAIELRLGEPVKRKDFVKDNLVKILIWVVIIGAAFAFAWSKGYLTRLANYVALTREELRKCTWPTWDELKGSTLVVTITIALLGLFTFAVDEAFAHIVRWIS
jgi:preprotein translocase subunit SecE